MLFNLFKKKEPEAAFKDLVWMTNAGKLKGMVQLFNQYPNAIVAAWFPETIQQLEQLGGLRSIADARNLRQAQVSGKVLIIAEHYPLREKEEQLLQMQATQVFVCSALDEPLLQHFGSDKILLLMQKMGMTDSENIEHPLIKQSIKRAQEKLSEKVLFDRTAASSAEWFRINVSPE